MKKLTLLLIEFFRIALFTIGGGVAMIPVIEETFVKKHKLLEEEDIMDMISVTQTIPGLIAINSAVFVGHKLAGWKGSLAATIGVITPSMIIIMIIAALFPLEKITDIHLLSAFSCVRATVLGIFVVIFFKIAKNIYKTPFDIPVFIVMFYLLLLKLHPALTVIICCLIGGIYETYFKSKLTGEKSDD